MNIWKKAALIGATVAAIAVASSGIDIRSPSVLNSGASGVDLTLSSSLTTPVLDAGVALINGQLQVLGPVRADSSTATVAVLDAGVALVNGQLQVLGATVSSQANGSNAFGVLTNGARIDFGAGTSDYASSDGTTVSFAGPVTLNGNPTTTTNITDNGNLWVKQGYYNQAASPSIFVSPTAPTISSGFGSSPSVVSSNGSVAFQIDVGTGGTASSGVIGLPTATTGWTCNCADITTPGANITRMTANSTTSCTVTNVKMSDGSSAAWTASDKLWCTAIAQ